MSEFSIVEFFLTGLLVYGSYMFGLGVFLAALGFPVPSTLLVLAGGAFAQQGTLALETAFPLGLLGAICGDSLSYAIGRIAKNWVERRFGQTSTWQTAQGTFQRRGGVTVYLTRFLLTPLAIPTNLIAGSSGYQFRRFILYDIAGEVTWLLLYGSLGYLFGSNWEALNQFVSDLSGVLAGIAILAIGIFFLLRCRTRDCLPSLKRG